MEMDEIIAKYPKIFTDYEGNPGRVNWSIPEGWNQIVDWMCGCIQDYIDHTKTYSKGEAPISPAQVQCTQIKEKFGGLRFYTFGHNEVVDGMIKFAEYLCEKICVNCGSMEDVEMSKGGWISPYCKKCRDKKV